MIHAITSLNIHALCNFCLMFTFIVSPFANMCKDFIREKV
jgi:hypothetical protein